MQDPDLIVKPRDLMPETARTLPARYYVDESYFAREMERLFRRMWICAGRAEEIERAGQFVLRTVAGDSVIVTRSASGGVHAFHNVCRHRGTRLCTEGSGTVRGKHPVPLSRVDLRASTAG